MSKNKFNEYAIRLSSTKVLGLDATIFKPKGDEHTATVIWLHGLGDSGRGMIPGVMSLLQSLGNLGDSIKFLMPHAPLRSVTGNRGAVMPSWFDCFSFDIENREEDEQGLAEAAKFLNALIDIEVTEHGIPPERIIVGGLSQGGAVACRTLTTTERKLGGAFILSSYIPLRRKVPEMKSQMSSSTPILWGHGKLDVQVQFPFSLKSAEQWAVDLGVEFVNSSSPLTEKDVENDAYNIKLRFVGYDGLGHWFSEAELRDMALWMKAVLGIWE